jgi:hypothetical protein
VSALSLRSAATLLADDLRHQADQALARGDYSAWRRHTLAAADLLRAVRAGGVS